MRAVHASTLRTVLLISIVLTVAASAPALAQSDVTRPAPVTGLLATHSASDVDIDWQPHPTDNRRVVVEASAEMLPIEQVMGHLKDHFRLVGGRKVLFAPNGTAIKAVGA